MNKDLPRIHVDKRRSPPLRPSVLPTIDRVTGRLFKALLGVVVLGTIAALGAAAYRAFGTH